MTMWTSLYHFFGIERKKSILFAFILIQDQSNILHYSWSYVSNQFIIKIFTVMNRSILNSSSIRMEASIDRNQLYTLNCQQFNSITMQLSR